MYFREMIIFDYVLFLCTFQLGFCAEFNTDGVLAQPTMSAILPLSKSLQMQVKFLCVFFMQITK